MYVIITRMTSQHIFVLFVQNVTILDLFASFLENKGNVAKNHIPSPTPAETYNAIQKA